MWTAADRERYGRDGLRYPSDPTDAEWAPVPSFAEATGRDLCTKARLRQSSRGVMTGA
jgi:hypothetical protein